MALKLGELLLKEQMITSDQLDEALKNQMIYGIRLGSSLIEMGYVSEEDLARLLGQKFGYPCVGPDDLKMVPREVIRLVEREKAAAHRIIPFRITRNRLSLAMTDPTDLKVIDEIAFSTGYVVQPHIALDVHISRALSAYYRISSHETRYEQLAALARKKREDASKKPRAATITMPTISETGELLNVTIPAEFEGFASLQDGEGDLFPAGDGDGRYTVDRLSIDFAAARTRDEVADVFISYLGQEFTVGALFIIRNNAAVGWRAVRSAERVAGFADLSLLLSKPSVLRDVNESRTFAMGPLINTPENRQIHKALGTASDVPLLVLPVIMLNKVVAAVLVSADMDALGKRLAELQKLVRKASLAFEMLIIKNKILMT